jgi:hypothetical protein
VISTSITMYKKLRSLLLEDDMKREMSYKYNNEYGTLQQFDQHGILRSSMSMPKSDLQLIAQLNIKENILRKIDDEVKIDV